MEDIKNNEGKAVKVTCSFCGKDMECPEHMLAKSDKHMCFTCFNEKNYPNVELKNVHIDIPINELHANILLRIADKIADEGFPELWHSGKEGLKMMSKRELAEEMFGAGVYIGIKNFIEMIKKPEEEGELKEEK